MELGGVPEKMAEYFSLGTYILCCSSKGKSVSSMYKGIYYIRNCLWGVATLDV